jgi:LacI family transcriptional regulator
MREVAAAAGVSAKTVSRVMHNDRYVSADVRQRVERAIVELEYVPNVLARSFRAGNDAAIGIAVPDVSDPFFAAVIRSVEQIARMRGVVVFVTSLSDDGARERDGLEVLLGRQIAGLIATPISRDQSYLKPWQTRMALVFIDRAPKRITADSVIEDDLGGAEMATAHLIRHGHRRIGFIGDNLSIATTARRLKGYRAALEQAGIAPEPDLVAVGRTGGIDVGRATLDLLEAENPPTALFSSNARCSVDIVPALQSIRRTDVALISFGDFPLASALQPPLTVIDQDPDEIGRLAATRLFERIDHPQRRLKRQMVLPVSLVRRASCCANGDQPSPNRPEIRCSVTE